MSKLFRPNIIVYIWQKTYISLYQRKTWLCIGPFVSLSSGVIINDKEYQNISFNHKFLQNVSKCWSMV
ncbi:unnamed protein product [Schistosoma intercalatum]|nr:unnamed protein product [Schistosoma intercalatum]